MVRRLGTTEQDQRRQQRRNLTLQNRLVSKGMQERYLKSAPRVLAFVQEFTYQVASWEDLDSVVAQWLEHMFHDGQHKSLASDGLAGLQHYVPQAIGRLRHS